MLMPSSSNHNSNSNSTTSTVSNATSFLNAVFDPLGSSSGHRSTTSTRRRAATTCRLYNSTNSNHIRLLSDTSESSGNNKNNNNSSIFHPEECSSYFLNINNNNKSDNWIDPRITKALRSAQSSLTAIVDVLQHEGVATATVQELREQITLHTDPTTMMINDDKCDLANILTRCQDYAAVCTGSCCGNIDSDPSPSASSAPSSSSFQLMMACLIRAAWQTICQYQSLQYRAAYKYFHAIRRRRQPSATKQQIATALERQIAQAEQVCAAQKGYILATAWEQKLTQIISNDKRTTMTMNTDAPDVVAATI